jgi:hypothetical protein
LTLSRDLGVAALGLAVARGLVGQSLDDAIVGGMLGEVGEPQDSGALGREDGRYPYPIMSVTFLIFGGFGSAASGGAASGASGSRDSRDS